MIHPSEQAEPSGTDLSPRTRAKREAILDAAEKVFVAEGYAASIDRIAAAAGVAKQTVYSHFGSKEGLFRAMAEHSKRDFATGLQNGSDLRTALVAFGTAVLKRVLDPDTLGMQRLLIAQAATFPDIARIFAEVGPARSAARLADLLSKAMDDGLLMRADATLAAEDFLGLLQGQRRLKLLFGYGEPPGEAAMLQAAERAADVFLRAYAPG
ncbi:TetR/AcrR family transcriptional regulator [Chelatococcus sp. SYSU_G07232]|uniref:TetR/AcrR family transcriptional regulator n=1 Tax=Chelatococcus albus TaxID=3047466 RepID=A0ABT7AFL5_9HYPH|nr:TetR/AcrR family transcriptional regulator [Chelatococcus sp. SYSU_G07232]MDJ1158166.1 TetR/AcrR family transcriptional regulator [Chelatococcus sp. SYSU_G07232]